jgi:hypothetical protein
MMRLTVIVAIFFSIMIPLSTRAVVLGGLDETAGKAGISQSSSSPEEKIAKVIGQVLSYVGVLFLILMLYAGFLWMTAGGDEKRIDQARDIILGALIGLIIVVAAYAITQFVGQSVLGANSQP